jgi:predicted CoA-binding protein
MDLKYKESVDTFLKQLTIAVIGFSSDKSQPANYIYQRLAENNYTVFAVNTKGGLINEVKCYNNLGQINTKVEGVILCTPPAVAEEIVKQCIRLNIKHVWMHRSIDQGSFNEKAMQLCKDNGINCITIGCPLMFINADFPHKCIKWILNITGSLKIS